jgi:predicted lipid carrier protein YhbT
MAKDAVEFLQELGRRGHEPLWGRVRGRARLELVGADRVDRWMIAIDGGDVVVSHKGGAAACTIRGDRALFDRLCRGEENALAAVLRGALVCTGEVELLYAIQRVFPGPSGGGTSEAKV